MHVRTGFPDAMAAGQTLAEWAEGCEQHPKDVRCKVTMWSSTHPELVLISLPKAAFQLIT